MPIKDVKRQWRGVCVIWNIRDAVENETVSTVVEYGNMRRCGFRLCSVMLRLSMIVLLPVFPCSSFVKQSSLRCPSGVGLFYSATAAVLARCGTVDCIHAVLT